MIKLTGLDSKEIPRYTYDEDKNAQRVVLVGDFGIAESIKESLKDLKIDLPTPQIHDTHRAPEIVEKYIPGPVQTIEVPVIVRETQFKDVPVIIKETEYKEISVPTIVKETEFRDVPVLIKETEIRTIEVPTIIKEIEYKEISVPVIQTEVRVIEVEKPIIQKELEIQRVEVPVIVREKEIQLVYVDKLNYKLLFIFQALTFGLIVLSKFIK
jgi:hypothetical protein